MSSKGTARSRIAALVILLVALLLGGRLITGHLLDGMALVHALGIWGPVIFVAVYALLSLAFVPAGLLTLCAGLLFGLRTGILSAFAGATLGACASFALSRYAGRAMVERHVAGSPRLARFVRAVSTDGRRIVFLLRLSPVIPFAAINWTMGVTSLRFMDFAISCIGMLPVTILYVYYGVAAGTLAVATGAPATRGDAHLYLLLAGLIATIAASTLVARAARRALAKDEQQAS